MYQVLTGALLLTTLALGFVYFRQVPTERLLRYTLAAPENSTVHSFAVSPDGRFVTIAAVVDGKRQLWLRPLDALQAQPMPGTEDGTYPFWSPDSRYIGFFAQGKLKRIAASGGPTQSLCDAPAGRGGSWNREGVIVFSPSGVSQSAVQQIPAAGGIPSNVTTAHEGDSRPEGAHRVELLYYPIFLPDGHHFLYVVSAASLENNGVYVSSLDGGENRRVLADLSSVVFAPLAFGSRAGYLLFIRDHTLMAQPFDAGSAQLSGDVFPIAEGVSLTNNFLYAPVTVSENGLLAYASGGTPLLNQIVWFDRAGKQLGPASASGNVFAPSISPDEKTMAYTRNAADGTADIWLRDLARNTDVRFTSDDSLNFSPFWSPNADRIAFRSNRRRSPGDLYQKAASGSGEDELLLSTPNPKLVNQWSRDGRIVFTETDPKTKEDLWVLPSGQGEASFGVADRRAVKFLNTEFREFQGQISPDGHWMAYTSDETRQREVSKFPLQASRRPT
jgi:Tol biopolymer transport system component